MSYLPYCLVIPSWLLVKHKTILVCAQYSNKGPFDWLLPSVICATFMRLSPYCTFGKSSSFGPNVKKTLMRCDRVLDWQKNTTTILLMMRTCFTNETREGESQIVLFCLQYWKGPSSTGWKGLLSVRTSKHSANSSSPSRAHFHFVFLVLLNRWVRFGIWIQVIAIGMPPSLQGITLVLCRFLPVQCWFIWPFEIDRFSSQWVCFHLIHTYNQPKPCRFSRQYTTHIPISHPGYVSLSTTPALPMTL